MADRASLTIFIPQRERDAQVRERLQKLARERDRSVNYLAVQAILQFLESEEGS